MAAIGRSLRRFGALRSPRRAPLHFPTTGYDRIPLSATVEEERYPWYSTKDFYPARMGEVLADRYQLVGKLGYGAYSTAWLARDLCSPEHVAVKIAAPAAVARELPMLRRLAMTEHPGSHYVRRLRDEFVLQKDAMQYHALVFDPGLCTLLDFRVIRGYNEALPPVLVKAVVRHVLYTPGAKGASLKVHRCKLVEPADFISARCAGRCKASVRVALMPVAVGNWERYLRSQIGSGGIAVPVGAGYKLDSVQNRWPEKYAFICNSARK